MGVYFYYSTDLIGGIGMAYYQYYLGDVQVSIARAVTNQTTGEIERGCTEAEFERAKVIIECLSVALQTTTPPARLEEIVFDWKPGCGKLSLPIVRFVFAEPLTYSISIHLVRPIDECPFIEVTNQILQTLAEKLQERLMLWLQYTTLLTELVKP